MASHRRMNFTNNNNNNNNNNNTNNNTKNKYNNNLCKKVNHIYERVRLHKTQYKRHDTVVKTLHWKLSCPCRNHCDIARKKNRNNSNYKKLDHWIMQF